jgi:hypothetical protein
MSTPKDLPPFLHLDSLIIEPPTTTNGIVNFTFADIAADAKATHILLHPRYPALLTSFLAYKRANGSIHERDLYANLSWQKLAARFINARPLAFVGSSDFTLLREGTTVDSNATQEWDRNGTAFQHLNTHLTLEHYLSYDEIMLSSLLGVSGPSYFINTGSRYNRARPAPERSYEPRGIIVGLVGSRFERENRMDSVHIIPPAASPEEEESEEAETLQDPAVSTMIQTFLGAPRDSTLDFDIVMYKARCRVTAEMFLLEANARAADAGQKAWAYVVGLGLGVWQHTSEQRDWYVSAWGEALDSLDLAHVGTVEFAYISDLSAQVQAEVRDLAARKGIRVIFSRRDPAEKLQDGELLVLSYAWDGNAFPGNEYWLGSLTGSGDPAAACMSTVAELHNPLVNPEFTRRIKVAGKEGYA